MHDVETHVTGARHAEHRVEVGAVVVEQGACLVDHLGDDGDVFLKHPDGVGVGHHHGGHAVIEFRREVVDVDGAVGQALDFDYVETGHRRAGWVGAVSRVRNDDGLAAEVVTVGVVGSDDEQACQLAVALAKGFRVNSAMPPISLSASSRRR